MLERITDLIQPEHSVKKRFLWALLSTVCFSLLANGFSYFNFYPIHDAVDFWIGGPWREWQFQLGRFLIPLWNRIRSPFSMPWLIGVLSMPLLGMSVFIVAELLGQTSRLGIVLISGFLSANLFMLEINTGQQYFSDVFLLSLFFACLGVCCIFRGRGWRRMIASAVCLVVSYGLYQAFITFAACLCMLALMRDAIQKERMSKSALRDAALCFAVMAGAGVVYLALSRLALRAMNLEPSDVSWSIYTTGNTALSELWASVRANYLAFFRLFFDGAGYVGRMFGLATCLLAVLAAVLTACKLRKRPWMLLFVAALLALFPLVGRLVNIFTGFDGAYRTMFAQFLIWPILLSMIFWCLPGNARRRSAAVAVAAILSAFIIAGNIRFNNGGFTVQRILNERALYHTGRVMQDLERFDTGKKMAIHGKFTLESPNDDLLQKYSKIDGFEYSTGVDSELAFVRYANMLGYTLDYDPAYWKAVKALPEVKAMPAYPEEGYILELEDYVVIRLGSARPHTSVQAK